MGNCWIDIDSFHKIDVNLFKVILINDGRKILSFVLAKDCEV